MKNNWREKANVGLLETRRLADHVVRIYENRLAISRKDGDRLTWEEVEAVKNAVWGDRVCVEVYPASYDVVNLRHTRHVWHTPELEQLVKTVCVHPEFSKEDGE